MLYRLLCRLLCRLARSGKDAAKSSVQAAVGVVRLLLAVWWQRECGGEVWQRCCAGCGAGCCPKSGGQGAVQATVHTAVEKSGKGAVQGAVQAAVHIARALGCNGLCWARNSIVHLEVSTLPPDWDEISSGRKSICSWFD